MRQMSCCEVSYRHHLLECDGSQNQMPGLFKTENRDGARALGSSV